MTRDYRGREDTNVDGIVERDLEDIAASDVVLVNGARASWGTAMEVVYAHLSGKHILVWAEGLVSPWLRFHATEVLTSIYAVESRLGYLAAVGV